MCDHGLDIRQGLDVRVTEGEGNVEHLRNKPLALLELVLKVGLRRPTCPEVLPDGPFVAPGSAIPVPRSPLAVPGSAIPLPRSPLSAGLIRSPSRSAVLRANLGL